MPLSCYCLDREASERTCVDAHDQAHFIRKYNFLAPLLIFSDILPPLAQVSRAFQTDFSLVKLLIIATKTTFKDTPGQHFKSLPDVFKVTQRLVSLCQMD